MKNIIFLFFLTACLFTACSKDAVSPASRYNNTLSSADTSAEHPKNTTYQAIIDQYTQEGLLGVSVSIEDQNGTWLGAGGKADIISNVDMEVGHRFLIASVSKVFTATAIFTYLDAGLLSLEDPVNKWIDTDITNQIENADEAQIQHLLSHQSGIHDWYTFRLEGDRYNEAFNNWKQEDILEYVYGKPARFAVGTSYEYSNTNYVLLGMILEKVAGKSLKEVYQSQIFTPLNLESAYFGSQPNALSEEVVKGYYALVGRGYVEAQKLYEDELSTGDGGISINVQDLGRFVQELMTGNLLSESSLAKMQDWFDIDENTGGGDGKNGYGLEYFVGDYGISYGHTGGVDGFSSSIEYYPENGTIVTYLFNFSPGSYADFMRWRAFIDAMNKEIFED